MCPDPRSMVGTVGASGSPPREAAAPDVREITDRNERDLAELEVGLRTRRGVCRPRGYPIDRDPRHRCRLPGRPDVAGSWYAPRRPTADHDDPLPLRAAGSPAARRSRRSAYRPVPRRGPRTRLRRFVARPARADRRCRGVPREHQRPRPRAVAQRRHAGRHPPRRRPDDPDRLVRRPRRAGPGLRARDRTLPGRHAACSLRSGSRLQDCSTRTATSGSAPAGRRVASGAPTAPAVARSAFGGQPIRR